uniref:Uncharacterized protein n=1 Tax=Leersia perrieri TaxID=77586 RepID=A0A0D9X2N1_9ORYZ
MQVVTGVGEIAAGGAEAEQCMQGSGSAGDRFSRECVAQSMETAGSPGECGRAREDRRSACRGRCVAERLLKAM